MVLNSRTCHFDVNRETSEVKLAGGGPVCEDPVGNTTSAADAETHSQTACVPGGQQPAPAVGGDALFFFLPVTLCVLQVRLTGPAPRSPQEV